MLKLNGSQSQAQVELLLSYSPYVWSKLPTSSVLHHVIQLTQGSVTLINNFAKTIASTRNNKQRRKYILRLVEYTESIPSTFAHPGYSNTYNMTALTSWLLVVMDSLHTDRVVTVPTDTVRYITHANSPDIAPYTVGDSKHYLSCLRSGLIKYLTDIDDKEPTAAKCNEYIRTDECIRYRGCNFKDHSQEEYTSFHNGTLMYAIIGGMVYEDGVGPSGRVRIHISPDEDGTLIVDDFYGVGRHCRTILLKLLEDYPGKVFMYPSVYRDNLAIVDTTQQCELEYDEYSDYSESKAALVTGVTDGITKTRLIRRNTRLTRRLITVRQDGFSYTHETTRFPEFCTKSTYKLDYLTQLLTEYKAPTPTSDSHNYHLNEDGTVRLLGNVWYGLTWIHQQYGIPFLPRYTGVVTPLSSSSTVWVDSCSVSWVKGAYRYMLDDAYGFPMLRRISTTREECHRYYHLRTGKWVQRCSFIASEFRITRHTIQLVRKFLPQSLKIDGQRNRVHLLPKL